MCVALFPCSFSVEIHRAAKKYGVDEALIFAVVNTESSFDPLAVSNKGACGLMQLLPSTAEWCAVRLGEQYSYERLFEPDFNVRMGTYYLSYLTARFDGCERAAVAAYNAGEGNVSSWIEKAVGDESKMEIDFPETSAYVKKVALAERVYAARLKARR